MSRILRDAAAAPLDYFKSLPWLANVGHFLAGYSVVLTAAFWGTRTAELWVTGLLAAYVLVKEYFLDLRYESGETVDSSTIDALGYTLGVMVAWVEILLR
jgi:hypothetical protein